MMPENYGRPPLMDQPARQVAPELGPEQDAGHEPLRLSINRLRSHPEAGVNSELVAEELDRLTRYGHTRFAAEDAMLARAASPGWREHIEEHRRFKRRIAEFCCAAMAGVEQVPDLLRAHLEDWWVRHVMVADREVAQSREKSDAR